ncbi:MAG TPA: hypothetical protein VEI57_11675 [Nitrospirota bacterium]|nr:hypothetical protein [Nitrospirota bacterium]
MDYGNYQRDSAADRGESVLWPLFLFSITLFAAGLWIALDSMSSYDFMMGSLSMLVFGPSALFTGYKLKHRK